jgi:hypothetical protein
VLPVQARTPAQIIGELLAGHPEAASLQAEASHCQALARSSAARAGQAFAAAQAARLGYEEERHRLDPRRRHTVDLGAGSLILAFLGAGLTLLNAIELTGPLDRTGPVLPAPVAAAVWLTGAWVAALASRERRWGAVLALAVAATVLGLLLAALHGSGHRSVVLGILISAFILALAAGAAALMAKMESSAVFLGRRRWHSARAVHAAQVRTARSDMEMATVATEAWLGLVRSRASMLADDGKLVRETLALAIELLPDGHLQLPSGQPSQPLSGGSADGSDS